MLLLNSNVIIYPSRSFFKKMQISNKKAVLFGLNYTGSGNALDGCINDIRNVRDFLLNNKINGNDIKLFEEPTAQTMLNEMTNLIVNSGAGDLLFIHYSGHGSRISGGEGVEECIFGNGFTPITGTQIRTILTKAPEHITIISVFDCCHSGSICDLRYNYKPMNNEHVENINSRYVDTNAQIFSFSGCQDDQSSAETLEVEGLKMNPRIQGAMTTAFISLMRNGITFGEMIERNG